MESMKAFPAADVLRGEIYYVKIPHHTGHEMEKDRPAIIVSCDAQNKSSPVVSVVMCSASSQREMPEHITIRTTPVQSTAMCEHIYTVDKSSLGKWVGRLSEAEMEAVDRGIRASLGLFFRARVIDQEEEKANNTEGEKDGSLLDLVRAEAERDTYKAMYERLLYGMTMERRVGA